ncbi:MAG: glycosyltransferase [Phycisphaeraceae bacterium]
MTRSSGAATSDPAGELRDRPLTLAHVTHEAVEQLGGIGTVLEGLMCSPVYQQTVKRSILIGPTATHMQHAPNARLGAHGQVLYSSIDQVDELGLAGRLRPVEWAFNVAIVYGKRTYDPPGQGRQGEAEVLLIDVFRANPDRLNVFKHRLWERFGLDSGRYESSWDYEEYVRLAEPAFYALQALLGEEDAPCILFAHEFMGMPAALQAIMDGGEQFRTVFHAHECATARRLVEDHPGHDTMFYNVLGQAREQGLFAGDVFGDLDGLLRHALISRAHLCDGVIAVGDHTRDELAFLNQAFSEHPIELVYNGLPAFEVTSADREKSRDMLAEYAESLVGYRPDVLMTHVTRPVISKGMWRDVKLCAELNRRLGEKKKKAVLFILTSAGGVRRGQDVAYMERQYGWPRHHRDGYPDLVGPEVELARMIEPYNAEHENVQVVLVNQFGWSRERIGRRLPQGMSIADLRRGTDVELGMATYEPFGISPLEPLGSGALCVISNVCGCRGFVDEATGGKGSPNVMVADFTKLDRRQTIAQLLKMDRQERDAVEERVVRELADEMMGRLPLTKRDREKLLKSGQALVQKMGWDQIVEGHLARLLAALRHLTPEEAEA